MALVTLISVLAGGCVAVRNPARHPTPNDQEVMVKVDELYRGDEKLDEQDYYELAGDHESAAKIRKSRDRGEIRQSIGAFMFVTGVAFLAGGLYAGKLASDGDTRLPSWVQWAASGGGLAVGYIGVLVRSGGKEAAAPTSRMFDASHAQRSLETGRYGAKGLTAESIKALVIATKDGKQQLCSYRGVELADLVAKDGAGHIIKLDDHLDWFTWKTTPESLLDEVKKDDRAEQPKRHVRSPLRSSLALLGSDVTVTVSVAKGTLSQSLTLHQDFGCEESLKPAASHAVVEVAFVSTPDRRHMLLVATDGGDSAIVGEGGRILIDAQGDTGATGEAGRRGESYVKPHVDFDCIVPGGPGGDGRPGGPGGSGGTVSVRAANKAALDALEVTVQGGPGGDGGSGGEGGLGEAGSGCRAATGKAGVTGQRGPQGPPGTLERSVVTPTSLKLIAKILASNPALTLDR